jgi:hypothetical protein
LVSGGLGREDVFDAGRYASGMSDKEFRSEPVASHAAVSGAISLVTFLLAQESNCGAGFRPYPRVFELFVIAAYGRCWPPVTPITSPVM